MNQDYLYNLGRRKGRIDERKYRMKTGRVEGMKKVRRKKGKMEERMRERKDSWKEGRKDRWKNGRHEQLGWKT